MAEIGWVKFHRQIQESNIWTDKEPFDRRSAWVDLIMMANHEDRKVLINGKLVVIKRGQKITSLYKLAERWHWSRDRVRRYLTLLESDNMIVRESNNINTTITIVNYSIYQDKNTTRKTTNKTTDKTTDNTTDNTQTRINKNDKEVKNEKNIYGEYSNVRLTDQEREKLINDYGQQMTDDSIRFLDEYIEMKGYKAKSHYLCIRKWVVNAVKDSNRKNKPVDLDKWWEGL